MRARDIKPGFFKNDQLAECSMAARLLFVGLWMLADRQGRLERRPRKIKGELFPFDELDVAPLLAELERAGLVAGYEVQGRELLWVPNFRRHQSPHRNEKASELPPHPAEGAGLDFAVAGSAGLAEDADKERHAPGTPERAGRQGLTKGGHTSDHFGSAPEILGLLPLTPSSLTPSSLSSSCIHTAVPDTEPQGVSAGQVRPHAPAGASAPGGGNETENIKCAMGTCSSVAVVKDVPSGTDMAGERTPSAAEGRASAVPELMARGEAVAMSAGRGEAVEPGGNRKRAAPFHPPTVAEVAEYCRAQGCHVDAARFCDFYAAKGWVIGRSRMKDWRAAVRTWARGDSGRTQGARAATVWQERIQERDIMARMLAQDEAARRGGDALVNMKENRRMDAPQIGYASGAGAAEPALPPDWQDCR